MNEESIGAEARDALRRHVLAPLMTRCIDREYGGFLTDFDERWQPHGAQEKSLEHAARTTIVFALLAQAMPGQDYERFARHGCAFLQQAMWDDVHGGFYARVERSGRPLWEGLKHPHAVNYVVRAFLLAAPFLQSGEGEAWAVRALTWLDDVAWDEEHGGYWGSYRRNNERYADGAVLPTPDGRDIFGLVPGFKEINTLGDAIEMLAGLEAAFPQRGYEKKLLRLAALFVAGLMQPNGVLPYRYLPDWRPAPDLVRVGYQFQMARHLLAPEIAGVPRLLEQVREMVEFCFRSATHPAGGYSFAVTADGRAWPATGASTDERQWWVQIEAVHTLHVLGSESRIEPEARERYRLARDRQWAFFRENFFDERNGGIHELPRELPGAAAGKGARWPRQKTHHERGAKSHCWKDASHEVGAFLALSRKSPVLQP
jgi:cellobiose epimerase